MNSKENYQKYKEYYSLYAKNKYKKNRDKILQKTKAYYWDNREDRLTYQRSVRTYKEKENYLCIICGNNIHAYRPNKYCCITCMQKAKWIRLKSNKDRLKKRHERNNIYNHKRRALISDNSPDNINRIDVFNRDKWRCCMCGIKVQIKKHTQSNAAQLDHIIPLAKGGVHKLYNVQTLCRRCNIMKSDKLIGQLNIAI